MLTTLKWGRLPLAPENRTQIYKGVWQFAGINLVFGALAPGIDNLGHLGGFIYGLLIGAVMGKHLDDSATSRGYRRKAWLWLMLGIGFILLILSRTRWIVHVPARH
jgi:rhomboid protease GluP